MKSRCPTPPALSHRVSLFVPDGGVVLVRCDLPLEYPFWLVSVTFFGLPALGNGAQDLLHSLSGQRARQLADSQGYSALLWSIWMKS